MAKKILRSLFPMTGQTRSGTGRDVEDSLTQSRTIVGNKKRKRQSFTRVPTRKF